MTLEEIKQELDRLNQNDFEEIKLFIRDKSISNEYVRVLLDALEARYSSFVCPICGSAHIIRTGIIQMVCKSINVMIVIAHLTSIKIHF